MPTYRRKRMCSECPFRAISVRGWLGPCTPEEVNAVIHSEQSYICHKEINRLMGEGMDEDEIEEVGQHCVGMARYRNSVLKLVRDREGGEFQTAVASTPDEPVIAPWKFLEHHARMSPAQKQRQKHRNRGRYAKVNPCYVCGKSAGVNYESHPDTDRTIGDELLCLCADCANELRDLSGVEAVRRAFKKSVTWPPEGGG